MLPKLFDNAPSLASAHSALLNNDRLNRMIQRERVKQYPYGMDFLGMSTPWFAGNFAMLH
jgi:hypothetical protein